ncbi:XRE family transcriptional regulator [Demequina capsici]|uniref:XRE family transcriptional regulator n=1 Tax=Demequina capsici TaxID=3075620 RepID=A0AA96FB57_9MICO|nr:MULTISPECIES: XRE family transcriptional regulator [unclassified Demequina]WNM23685.1 XRE family transcriptional regulator [Demequina sp. OYTSA14]WNM26524.1 XRE family transcriptional regulator [Demequina sp. PMTSA13]
MVGALPGTDSEAAGARLGAHVRELRRARGLTLVQLAEATGLSHPFLSQVERGLANFSLPSLRRIAVALETSPVELMAASEPGAGGAAAPPVEVHRATAHLEQVSDFAQDRALPLAHGARPFLPMAIECTRSDHGEAFTHAEDEWVTVLEGTLHLELDGQVRVLRSGDAAYYAGGVVHRWWTDGGPARLLAVKQQSVG